MHPLRLPSSVFVHCSLACVLATHPMQRAQDKLLPEEELLQQAAAAGGAGCGERMGLTPDCKWPKAADC